MIVQRLILIQSDIDDDTAENLASFQQEALRHGARDCVLIPIHMKKNRPGIRVEVLCTPEHRLFFQDLLIAQTTTIGFRVIEVERHSLERRELTVDLEGCPVRCKAVYDQGKLMRIKPEHDDCLSVANALDYSLAEVKARAHAAALSELKPQN